MVVHDKPGLGFPICRAWRGDAVLARFMQVSASRSFIIHVSYRGDLRENCEIE